jgi:hypothetical protein
VQGRGVDLNARPDEKHALLRRAGMPSYYVHYTFRDGKLAHFKFGLEYP